MVLLLALIPSGCGIVASHQLRGGSTNKKQKILEFIEEQIQEPITAFAAKKWYSSVTIIGRYKDLTSNTWRRRIKYFWSRLTVIWLCIYDFIYQLDRYDYEINISKLINIFPQ